MGVGVKLSGDSGDPLVIGITEGVRGNSRTHIDVFFAVHVVRYCTLARNDLDGETAVSLRDVFGIKFKSIHFCTCKRLKVFEDS